MPRMMNSRLGCTCDNRRLGAAPSWYDNAIATAKADMQNIWAGVEGGVTTAENFAANVLTAGVNPLEANMSDFGTGDPTQTTGAAVGDQLQGYASDIYNSVIPQSTDLYKWAAIGVAAFIAYQIVMEPERSRA